MLNVKLRFTASVPPPAPSKTKLRAPDGLTRHTPTSSGNVWLKPNTLTWIAVTVPRAAIGIVLGYGVPAPESGIVMGVALDPVMVAARAGGGAARASRPTKRWCRRIMERVSEGAGH